MTIKESIEQIIDWFTALVLRAEAIVFPSNRKGVFSPRGMQEWPKFRKIIYTLARPSFLDEGWGGWQIIIMIFLGILAMSCLILAEKLTLGLSISADWIRVFLVSLFLVFSYWGVDRVLS